MITLTEQEEESAELNLDHSRFFDYLCKNYLSMDCRPESIRFWKNGTLILQISFSDLHYPKNLLKILKDELENGHVSD